MTVEILTMSLNQIFQDFVNSGDVFIDDFFEKYLTKKWANNIKEQRKFCFSLILSLMNYKETHYYIELYYDILSNELDYANYAFFWDVRSLGLTLKHKTNTKYANLDLFYLTPKEYIFILHKCLNYDMDTVESFEDETRKLILTIRSEKTRDVDKYCRGEDLNLTLFIREVCNRFIIDFENKDEIKDELDENEMDPRISGMRQSNLFISQHFQDDTRKTALRPTISFVDNKREKDELVKALKEKIKETNKYKEANIKLLAFMQEKDNMNKTLKQRSNGKRTVINKIVESFLDPESRQHFVNKLKKKDMGLLANGSTINDKAGRNLNKILKRSNEKVYNDLDERRGEFGYCIRKFLRDVQQKLNAKEYQYALFVGEKIDIDKTDALISNFLHTNNKMTQDDYMMIKTLLKFVINTEDQKNNLESTYELSNKKSLNDLKKLISEHPELKDIGTRKSQLNNYKDELKAEIEKLDELNKESEMIRNMSRMTFIKESNREIVTPVEEPKQAEELKEESPQMNNMFLDLNPGIDIIQSQHMFAKKDEAELVEEKFEDQNEEPEQDEELCDDRSSLQKKFDEENFEEFSINDNHEEEGQHLINSIDQEPSISNNEEPDLSDSSKHSDEDEVEQAEPLPEIDATNITPQQASQILRTQVIETEGIRTEMCSQTETLKPLTNIEMGTYDSNLDNIKIRSDSLDKVQEPKITKTLEPQTSNFGKKNKEDIVKSMDETVEDPIEEVAGKESVRQSNVSKEESRRDSNASFKRFSSFKRGLEKNSQREITETDLLRTEPIFNSQTFNDPHSKKTNLAKNKVARMNSLAEDEDSKLDVSDLSKNDIRRANNSNFDNYKMNPKDTLLEVYNSLNSRSKRDSKDKYQSIPSHKKIPNINVDQKSYRQIMEKYMSNPKNVIEGKVEEENFQEDSIAIADKFTKKQEAEVVEQKEVGKSKVSVSKRDSKAQVDDFRRSSKHNIKNLWGKK